MNRSRSKKLALNKDTVRTLGTRELERVGGAYSGGYSGCVSCGGANLAPTQCLSGYFCGLYG